MRKLNKYVANYSWDVRHWAESSRSAKGNQLRLRFSCRKSEVGALRDCSLQLGHSTDAVAVCLTFTFIFIWTRHARSAPQLIHAPALGNIYKVHYKYTGSLIRTKDRSRPISRSQLVGCTFVSYSNCMYSFRSQKLVRARHCCICSKSKSHTSLYFSTFCRLTIPRDMEFWSIKLHYWTWSLISNPPYPHSILSIVVAVISTFARISLLLF